MPPLRSFRRWIGPAVRIGVLVLAPPFLAAEDLQEIIVRDGDTIWSIANRYLQDPKRWPEILKYNQLPADPTRALPGMKLKVPILLIKESLRKATLVYLLNDVRYRKKGEPEWQTARAKLDLYNEDGLRTYENSQAHVNFHSGSLLKLDQNTLVILRPELKTEEASLLRGMLRTHRVKLVTPTAQITPQTQDTVYKAKVRSDRSVIVQVESGQTEVLGLESGQSVTVPAGFANVTLPGLPPSRPVRVPKMGEFEIAEFSPTGEYVGQIVSSTFEPLEPVGAGRRAEKEKSAPRADGAEKESSPRAASGRYRIQFALDPKFEQVALEKKAEPELPEPSQEAADYDLPDAVYYRRLLYEDAEGRPLKPVVLRPQELDRQPPRLKISSPRDGQVTRRQFINVEGQTEPKCFVTVNGYQVPIRADGKFLWAVVLKEEGDYKISIATRDRKGNVTQAERTVTKKKGISLDEEP